MVTLVVSRAGMRIDGTEPFVGRNIFYYNHHSNATYIFSLVNRIELQHTIFQHEHISVIITTTLENIY